MNKIEAYKSLANIFSENGYSLYLVGGSVRDYLLFDEIYDLDVATDATPDEIKSFYNGKATYTFEKYGAATIHFEGFRFDVTTLREESDYLDSRHPGKVKFVRDISIDVFRRDLTINSLYMDKNMEIFDFTGGVKDLNDKVLRMIGEADKRIKEDPLRILRTIRFKLTYKFSYDDNLKKAMLNNIGLINNLNKNKILEEIKKTKMSKDELWEEFNNFHITYLLDMIN